LSVVGGTIKLIAFRAVVEFDILATKFIVEPVNAIIIKTIGKITTRTRKTSKNAAIAERERFSRHRFIKGLFKKENYYLNKK
jgi:hypothetical protein